MDMGMDIQRAFMHADNVFTGSGIKVEDCLSSFLFDVFDGDQRYKTVVDRLRGEQESSASVL